MALIPFIRYTIGLLLCLTSAAFAIGVARIHMAILTFLSAGLLVSISFFQSEYEKMLKARSAQVIGSVSKTGGAQKGSVKERSD